MAFPTEADCERIYTVLKRIRRVEETVADIYPTDKVKSPVHLSIGQEAVAAAICDPLLPDDVIGPTYRSHAAYLAKGGSLRGMIAEMYGKATGVAAGKGGSMHLIDPACNVLGASAVVGTTIPLAVGYALVLKREGKGRVAVALFGDGATEEGVFYESLNFAALHRLPVLFVCENNGLAIHTPLNKRWASDSLTERVASFGVPAARISDGDVFAMTALARGHIDAMRTGTGPAFMECLTYRWREHVGPGEDYDAGYRARSELEPWQSTDQVERVGAMLKPERRAEIDAAIETEIADAVEFAETSPWPEPEELGSHVFAEGGANV